MENKKTDPGKVLFTGISIAFGMAVGMMLPKLGEFMNVTYGRGPALIAVAGYLVFIFVSLIFASAVHEAGHLIMGLATGYEFVSYRVLSLILQKDNGKIKLRKYSVPGTLGQCLMTYPIDKDISKAPYFLYHSGGVIFNLILALIGLIIMLISKNYAVGIYSFTFMLVSLYQFLTNAIPYKAGGFPNDAYNIRIMKNHPECVAVVIKQLIQNSKLGDGVEFKDMTEDMFEGKDPSADESIKVAQAINFACREMQQHRFAEAADILEKVRENQEAPMILRNEAACELMFIYLIEGHDKNKVDELYTKEVKAYIKQTEKYHIQKKKLAFTYKLLYENDKNAADKEYDLALQMSEGYPLKGEYTAEMQLVEYVKDKYCN